MLETSDVPPGVVNILTGDHAAIAAPMAGHMEIDSTWCFGAAPLSQTVEKAAASNLKRTWVNHGEARDWLSTADTETFLEAATEIKTVWIPYGA